MFREYTRDKRSKVYLRTT